MNKLLNILLIEDDKIEIMKFHRVVSKLEPKHSIKEMSNGEEALEYLEKNSLPDIILLDLNMPKMSGIEFLTHLKSHKTYKYIPTIILSTSDNPTDMLECYKIGIAGYMVKPLKYEDYVTKINVLIAYWSTSQLIKK